MDSTSCSRAISKDGERGRLTLSVIAMSPDAANKKGTLTRVQGGTTFKLCGSKRCLMAQTTQGNSGLT
eukprot:1505585-Alexandrium_andersonii.AAC.1